MLENIERRQIKQLLEAHCTLRRLPDMVNDAGKDYDVVVQQPANKLDAIMDILQDAERNGWTMNLLGAIVRDFEDHLDTAVKETEIAKVYNIEKLLIERLGRGTALVDPFKSCFVRGGWPFINRPQVSDAFAQLAKPAGFRILVLNGPAECGKTYSKELPQFVAEIQENKTFKIYYRDVSEGDYAFTTEKLVQSILREWNLDIPIPVQLSQSSSYATELSEWLAAKVPKDQTWWIIVDGLAKITPDPGLLNFLMALARHIADSTHALRLVLLDLGEQNLLPLAAELMTTKVKLDQITISDLMDHYFKVLHGINGAQNPFDSSLMTNKAQWVFEQIRAQTGSKKKMIKFKELLLQVTGELGFN